MGAEKILESKLQEVKNDFTPYDENFGLIPEDVECLIQMVEELKVDKDDQTEWANLYFRELQTYKKLSDEQRRTIEKYEKALRAIDTHIRSTDTPIPHIIKTLKQSLLEYE